MLFTSLFSQEQTTSKKFFGEIQAGIVRIQSNNGVAFVGITGEASATLGFNINQRFSVGVGVSTIHFVTATPYLYGKVNFANIEKRSIIPFLSVNAGYTINFESSGIQNDRISIQPKLGLSFYGKKKKSSFIVYIGGNYYYNKILPSVGIGLGF